MNEGLPVIQFKCGIVDIRVIAMVQFFVYSPYQFFVFLNPIGFGFIGDQHSFHCFLLPLVFIANINRWSFLAVNLTDFSAPYLLGCLDNDL